jgi:transcriptional regulator with XRE-family HTH domain
MISPFTGGKVTRKHKLETFTFRKEKFTVKRFYFVCNDTGREFTNNDVDTQVFNDIYKQYRERHGIPSPERLKDLRSKYGFSAHIMSKIAGMGINQYGLYENGEMPTIAMGQKLTLLFDKKSLLECIDKAQRKLGKSYLKIRATVEAFNEPQIVPMAKVFYRDFTEIVQPLICSKVEAIDRKPRWATYNQEWAMAY